MTTVHKLIQNVSEVYTVCPTRYRTRHVFNNSNTNEDIAMKFEHECFRCVGNEKECVYSVCTWRTPHSEKNVVWCGMSRWRIFGPNFFDATITIAAHMEIFNTFVNQLDDEELSIGYFQQDGVTSHTSHASMVEIQSFFSDCIISKGFGHRARPIWRRLSISCGDIWKEECTKTHHEP